MRIELIVILSAVEHLNKLDKLINVITENFPFT